LGDGCGLSPQFGKLRIGACAHILQRTKHEAFRLFGYRLLHRVWMHLASGNCIKIAETNGCLRFAGFEFGAEVFVLVRAEGLKVAA
jgi:hypothetical protein